MRGKTIHSYEYGCKVLGSQTEITPDESLYQIAKESEKVTIDGETYYAPNLKGFNGLTTTAIYYSDDYKQTKEVRISMHMNQQVMSYMKDGDTKYTWYDYKNKQWANIKTTSNGYECWWVWIPRYAYKIEGTNDIKIIYVDKNDVPLDPDTYGYTLPEGYEVHPSFQQKDGLTGIWTSKYAPSYGKYKLDDLEMSEKTLEPDLSGFTNTQNVYLIKYDATGQIIESETPLSEVSNLSEFNSDKKWYDYENKKWANIKVVEKSIQVNTSTGEQIEKEYVTWWVWIPRYAYRLPDNPNDDTEIIFLDENNNALDSRFQDALKSGEFTIHPAFEQDTTSDGKPLKGIWISKYAPSHENDETDDLPMSNKVLEPDMSGYEDNKENVYLVKYDEKGNETATPFSEVSSIQEFNQDNSWYDYENKKWANIKIVSKTTEEQEVTTYWVWIPKYAYKLPDNPNDDTEIIFLDENNNALDPELQDDLDSGEYTIHPAFTQDGGLKGIWMSKYAPSEK